MLDLKWIRENPDDFNAGLAKRGLPAMSADILKQDAELRAVKGRVQEAQALRNAASKDIGKAKGMGGDAAKAEALMAEVAKLKETIAAGEDEERRLEKALNDLLAGIPNMPLDDVPEGADEHGNVEVRRWGSPRDFAGEGFVPKQHFEIGEALRQMDFEAAAKMSGARFVVLKGGLARLERALGAFMLDLHTQDAVKLHAMGDEPEREIGGYTEVNPPILVKDDAVNGTAQLPKFEDDLFRVPFMDTESFAQHLRNALESFGDNRNALAGPTFDEAVRLEIRALQYGWAPYRYWLIPTAEVPLTNLVRESILPEADLPYRFTALTPCFRAEAGAAGKDTRGMIRQHQFSKVELVSIATPEQSAAEHERMTASAEEVLRRLELPYRTMLLCTGDMGFASRKTYDIEVWLPGQNAYREISSCSICGDFQARRMDARYRPSGVSPSFFAEAPTRIGGKNFMGSAKKPEYVHTLNGSGLAVGRTLVAVLENYQEADGSVRVPQALIPYMGGATRIAA